MKMRHLLMVLLAALYAGQAMSCELTHHKGEKHHKHPCAEQQGKPCHLHDKVQEKDGGMKPASGESKAVTESGMAPSEK